MGISFFFLVSQRAVYIETIASSLSMRGVKNMENLAFDEGFLWGCATASYQVEGAGTEGGRKPCIWDTFAKVPGKVFEGADGSVADDQYHRYQQDIDLMKHLGFKAYRFSIAWPRIIPNGTGEVNPEGVAYYHRLLEALQDADIKAVATLYHWDLPQSLEDAGGWAVRETACAYAAYAKACFDSFGDSVDQWITLNEPYCSAYNGYLFGVHAPGRTSVSDAAKAVHHLNLAHGLAVKAFRKSGLKGKIGITWNLNTPRPATNCEADRKAAELATAFESGVFVDPVFGKGYPVEMKNILGIEYPVQDKDMALISQPIDFVGVNYYKEASVCWDESAPFKYRVQPFWQETTEMGWPVVPEGLLRLLRWINKKSGGMDLYITENGCAYDDEVVVGNGGIRRVHDRARIEFLARHMAVCKEAVAEGIALKGYFVWSLLDNYEWAYGYSKRFGIVYVDYATQERIAKDSAYFMRDVIAGYGTMPGSGGFV